jgi:hypothetical protein
VLRLVRRAKTVVSLSPKALPALLKSAQTRMVGALDDIAAGHFPPRPADRQLCTVCAFATVCRKDYVADEALAPAPDEEPDDE